MWPHFPPSEKKKEVTEEVVEHVLHGISWSGQILSFHFFSLSLLFCYSRGSLSGLMFPRCSLFRSSFAAGNTHIVAKSLLVCVLCGYNDRLKSFLSFSVRGALRLAAVSWQVHFFLTNFNKYEDCQWMFPLAHFRCRMAFSLPHSVTSSLDIFLSDSVSAGNKRERWPIPIKYSHWVRDYYRFLFIQLSYNYFFFIEFIDIFLL